MLNFKQSLDRYLTTEPPDDTWWFELVYDEVCTAVPMTAGQWELVEPKVEKWADRLYAKASEVSKQSANRAASLIVRLLTKNGHENK